MRLHIVTVKLLGFFQIILQQSHAFTITPNTKNRRLPRGSTRPTSGVALAVNSDEDTDTPQQRNKKTSSKGTSQKRRAKSKPAADERMKKKEEIIKQLKLKLEERKKLDDEKKVGGLLERLNPFQAGQNFRKTLGDLGSLTALGKGLPDRTKQKYYLDDRFLDPQGGSLLSERNPYIDRLERENYVPEVLVVGATGEVGRLVVRRLLLEGRFRVRVLVRDLYSQTLNLLGTGVTYCQGDLNNVESLEYALTDVDKIVFCAGAPRPDEKDFQKKFKTFVIENLSEEMKDVGAEDPRADNFQWQQLKSVMDVRSQLAEQVDCIGMQNLVTAYQNVRYADYGTPQAAKRSLFKFGSRPEDFSLFAIDDGLDVFDMDFEAVDSEEEIEKLISEDSYFDELADDDSDEGYGESHEDEYDDEYYNEFEELEDKTVRTQVQWIRNTFGHGVFVGRIPTDGSTATGEAAVISSRLRSREEPESGINLSSGFAGFIVRLCGDGGKYECFIRTKDYDEKAIEYVCEFNTSTKRTSLENKSRNKFITCRLPFESFKPVLRKEGKNVKEDPKVKRFFGEDVRYIGFRYRCDSNDSERLKLKGASHDSFYIALSYIKVYRVQPEPEFVYLSDSRIPSQVPNRMVRHDRRQILSTESGGNESMILDESLLEKSDILVRSQEETYYKYRGEEILKKSGLSYTIVRVSGFNEDPSGEVSTIDLKNKSHHQMSPVSRAEVAQVCVGALLDPNALNKSVYMSKKRSRVIDDEDMSKKFAAVAKETF